MEFAIAMAHDKPMEDTMNKACGAGEKKAKSGDDTLRSYYEQIKTIPLLSFEEEQRLGDRAQRGDKAAQRRLIESNLRLVLKIARAYSIPDVPIMDLVQEGNIGLMRAVEKFESGHQVRFSTYAACWIKQTINRFLTNHRRPIRLPHRKEEALRKIQVAYHTMSQQLARRPTTTELAEEAGVSPEEAALLLNLCGEMPSLDSDERSDDVFAPINAYEDYTYCPERAFMRKNNRSETIRFMDRLSQRERRVLLYRYQFLDNGLHTLKKIGDKLGVSAETVRQIEIRALKKVHHDREALLDALYVG
jgi:RNA polymerase primary sigma factor